MRPIEVAKGRRLVLRLVLKAAAPAAPQAVRAVQYPAARSTSWATEPRSLASELCGREDERNEQLAELPLVIASNKQQPVGLGDNPKLVDPSGVFHMIAGIFPPLTTFVGSSIPQATKLGKINCSPFLDFRCRIPAGSDHRGDYRNLVGFEISL